MSENFSVADCGCHTAWDILLLQECFTTLDGVSVDAHDWFTPSELAGRLRCPAATIHQRWNGQAQLWEERADGLIAVEPGGQWTVISAHLPHEGRKVRDFETVLGGKSRIHERGTGTPFDLGWRFRCELVRIDRFSLRGRVDTKTENTDGHKAILLLARALHAAVAELDLTVRNTWMDADSEHQLYTRSSWTEH